MMMMMTILQRDYLYLRRCSALMIKREFWCPGRAKVLNWHLNITIVITKSNVVPNSHPNVIQTSSKRCCHPNVIQMSFKRHPNVIVIALIIDTCLFHLQSRMWRRWGALQLTSVNQSWQFLITSHKTITTFNLSRLKSPIKNMSRQFTFAWWTNSGKIGLRWKIWDDDIDNCF